MDIEILEKIINIPDFKDRANPYNMIKGNLAFNSWEEAFEVEFGIYSYSNPEYSVIIYRNYLFFIKNKNPTTIYNTVGYKNGSIKINYEILEKDKKHFVGVWNNINDFEYQRNKLYHAKYK